MTDPTGSRRVAVIGGGAVGLCTAWHLQQQGAHVTLFERREIGAGASWGNAGAVAPALAVPLPEPAALTAAARGLFGRDSAIVTPLRISPTLTRFLTTFARNATDRRWYHSMADYLPLTRQALAAYRELAAGGVDVTLHDARFVAVCRRAEEAASTLHELSRVVDAGLPVGVEMLTADELREAAPLADPSYRFGVRMHGQQFLDPPRLLAALHDSVTQRGGQIEVGAAVASVTRRGSTVLVNVAGRADEFDAAVLATGAWLPTLAREHGVRVPMQAGRGYSMSVPTPQPPGGMLYFAATRLACTPYRGGLRVSSVMELADPDRPPTRRHADAFLRRARHALPTADWDKASEVWVGSRPLTGDGRPLIGATNTPGVYVAGGHAMWGITLAPLTGKLLAPLVLGKPASPLLAPFDPVR